MRKREKEMMIRRVFDRSINLDATGVSVDRATEKFQMRKDQALATKSQRTLAVSQRGYGGTYLQRKG